MGKKLFLFAAAAVALASCTETDLSGDTSFAKESTSDAIQFSATARGTGTTRAGYENTTGMTTALLKNDGGTSKGFGVFAYYTGKNTYGVRQGTTYTGETSPQTNIAPNFMYNQQVTWSTDHWTYAPLKYWPNDIADGTAVDNQTTDGAATGSTTYGGNVSFFAYAPYVAYSDAVAGDGITGMSANNATGDPTITYTIPTDINAGGEWVDLLWGTLSGTTQTVLGTAQNGVTGDESASDNTYIKAILDGETVNADLNKQKVDGTVGFAFKHALAKIGGGSSGNEPKTGFLVVLDIDNGEEGAASTKINEGSREKFPISGTGGDDAWRTIVTIKNITITNDLNGATEGLGEGATSLGGSMTLNLATGKWSNLVSNNIEFTQDIAVPKPATKGALLNSKIAEIKENTTTWFSDLTTTNVSDYFAYTNTEDNTKVHPGVTETAQSVYNAADQSPIILFPGTQPKFKVTVDYIVRTYDANLNTKYSEVEQIISKVITFQNEVELNKHYTLLMHLGLTSVKFTATVSDWDVSDPDNDNVIEVEDAEDIHLPINVISSTEAVVPAGTSPTVYTAASTTSYTINLTGVASTNKYTATVTGGSGTPTISPNTGSFSSTSEAFTVTLPENSTASAVPYTVTITEYNDANGNDTVDAGETVTTTTVTIIQNKKVD